MMLFHGLIVAIAVNSVTCGFHQPSHANPLGMRHAFTIVHDPGVTRFIDFDFGNGASPPWDREMDIHASLGRAEGMMNARPDAVRALFGVGDIGFLGPMYPITDKNWPCYPGTWSPSRARPGYKHVLVPFP